jgi:hypothetical protein
MQSSAEKLQEIVESFGYKLNPMYWDDGTVSYSIKNKNGSLAQMSKELKEAVKTNVPDFSHFGMGDAIHINNLYQEAAIKPMLKQYIRSSGNKWIPYQHKKIFKYNNKLYMECYYKKAARVGVMVALPLNIVNPLTIGWSIIHPLEKKSNTNWEFGTELAIARASDWIPNDLITKDDMDILLTICPNAKIGRLLDYPFWLREQLYDFAIKTKKYFNVKYARVVDYYMNNVEYWNFEE